MPSANRVNDLIELILSSIETRDEGALSLRDYLISMEIDEKNATDLSTILHQLQVFRRMPDNMHFKRHTAEAVNIIQADSRLFSILDSTYPSQKKSRDLSE